MSCFGVLCQLVCLALKTVFLFLEGNDWPCLVVFLFLNGHVLFCRSGSISLLSAMKSSSCQRYSFVFRSFPNPLTFRNQKGNENRQSLWFSTNYRESMVLHEVEEFFGNVPSKLLDPFLSMSCCVGWELPDWFSLLFTRNELIRVWWRTGPCHSWGRKRVYEGWAWVVGYID